MVEFNDGSTSHRKGPCELWVDPLLHGAVYTKPVVHLDAHEAVVLGAGVDDDVQHRVLKGPAVFVPEPGEWLHEFSWHGDNGKGRKAPHQLRFEKLRVIPDQLYFNVGSVRTADEAQLTVQLMVFFELVDIEQMLMQTHDPIADFINAVSADIIRFAGECDFEEFKRRAKTLNQLDTYPELCRGADRIGYRISKVVYRGYSANARLQEMHDEAIELRTRLVLESETEEQQQALADLKLERKHEREAKVREENERSLDHRLEQETKEQAQRLDQQEKQAELDTRLLQQRHDTEIAHRKELQLLRTEEWSHLQATNADLTAILVAREHNPDKTIRLDQSGNAEVHLHEAI